MLFGVRARAGSGLEGTKLGAQTSEPKIRPRAGRLVVGPPRWAGGIVTVETKQRTMTKQEELFCLPNSLTELLGESF